MQKNKRVDKHRIRRGGYCAWQPSSTRCNHLRRLNFRPVAPPKRFHSDATKVGERRTRRQLQRIDGARHGAKSRCSAPRPPFRRGETGTSAPAGRRRPRRPRPEGLRGAHAPAQRGRLNTPGLDRSALAGLRRIPRGRRVGRGRNDQPQPFVVRIDRRCPTDRSLPEVAWSCRSEVADEPVVGSPALRRKNYSRRRGGIHCPAA